VKLNKSVTSLIFAGSFGAVKPGYTADVVLLGGNPLADISIPIG